MKEPAILLPLSAKPRKQQVQFEPGGGNCTGLCTLLSMTLMTPTMCVTHEANLSKRLRPPHEQQVHFRLLGDNCMGLSILLSMNNASNVCHT